MRNRLAEAGHAAGIASWVESSTSPPNHMLTKKIFLLHKTGERPARWSLPDKTTSMITDTGSLPADTTVVK